MPWNLADIRKISILPESTAELPCTTGFSHGTILGVADQVIDAVKSGAIRHFFLVAGCDGARSGRNYYTDFVKQTPSDSVILTLACGKYRFNDLDLGTIGGLPRLMDMGQCNDAYGAIKVAVALAEAFGCGVNELPLSMVLSWYEQKAVSILLTLASPWNQKHPSRPDPSGIFITECAQLSGRKLWNCRDYYAGGRFENVIGIRRILS